MTASCGWVGTEASLGGGGRPSPQEVLGFGRNRVSGEFRDNGCRKLFRPRIWPRFWRLAPRFLHFVACPSRLGGQLPKVAPSTNATHQGATQMITAFFAYVTVSFFAAIIAS